MEDGNLGDYTLVGDRVFEIRLHFGPGYRLYFVFEGQTIIILLCGGDKDSQDQDIVQAKNIARLLEERP